MNLACRCSIGHTARATRSCWPVGHYPCEARVGGIRRDQVVGIPQRMRHCRRDKTWYAYAADRRAGLRTALQIAAARSHLSEIKQYGAAGALMNYLALR